MIGLSFVDLSNTLIDKEFPRDTCSRGVDGSGDTMLLHIIVGLLEFVEKQSFTRDSQACHVTSWPSVSPASEHVLSGQAHNCPSHHIALPKNI